MAQKKLCKNCKIFVNKEDKCPICQGSSFLNTYKGVIAIINPKESLISKKTEFAKEGLYAIKIK